MLFLAYNSQLKAEPNDTVKLKPIEYVDYVYLIQSAALKMDFTDLSKYTKDTVNFEMVLTNTKRGENMWKHDVFDILSQCESIFSPDSLTIYHTENVLKTSVETYILELENNTGKTYFIFSVFDKKIYKVQIIR